MKTIFAVDDDFIALEIYKAILDQQYNLVLISSADELFARLEDAKPDLILLDIQLPGVTGFEMIQRLKARHASASIPVIFISAHGDPFSEKQSLELGAVDFIRKPLDATILLLRVKRQLVVGELVEQQTFELRRLQSNIILVVANMVEGRDPTTGGHIDRTVSYLRLLVTALKERKIYIDDLLTWDMEEVIASSRLHDIGKVSISDLILNKPSKLTQEEFKRMQEHAGEGERMINEITAVCGYDNFLESARLFAGYHHERWDGHGYPYGLKGESIPLHGRLMAIADVYDALVSTRPYKEAFTHEKACELIKEGSGTQFDPNLVPVFLEIEGQFKSVLRQQPQKEMRAFVLPVTDF